MTAIDPVFASLASTPLPELLASLAAITKHRSSIFTNWAATYRSQTEAIFQPETIQQVRVILELAKRQRKQVRGVGSGHSPSDLVCTNGWGINLDKMQKVINVSFPSLLCIKDTSLATFDIMATITPSLESVGPRQRPRGEVAFIRLFGNRLLRDRRRVKGWKRRWSSSRVMDDRLDSANASLDSSIDLTNRPTIFRRTQC